MKRRVKWSNYYIWEWVLKLFRIWAPWLRSMSRHRCQKLGKGLSNELKHKSKLQCKKCPLPKEHSLFRNSNSLDKRCVIWEKKRSNWNKKKNRKRIRGVHGDSHQQDKNSGKNWIKNSVVNLLKKLLKKVDYPFNNSIWEMSRKKKNLWETLCKKSKTKGRKQLVSNVRNRLKKISFKNTFVNSVSRK